MDNKSVLVAYSSNAITLLTLARFVQYWANIGHLLGKYWFFIGNLLEIFIQIRYLEIH